MNELRSTPPNAEKITPHHCAQRAYVYVRQSSPQQVQHHRESQRNQYALVDRAVALGWPPERVHLIDADLGQSGQDGQRPGFQELVGAVSLGHVGLILAYEASRLARSNAAWYTLLDLAAVAGALGCDLGRSPPTDLMPVRRHDVHRRPGAVTFLMAWVSVPDLAVHPSRQRYTFVRREPTARIVRYESLDGTFVAEVSFDDEGVVLDYPGIARRMA